MGDVQASPMIKLETCNGGSIVLRVSSIAYLQETRVRDRVAVALTMYDGAVFEINHSLDGLYREIEELGRA